MKRLHADTRRSRRAQRRDRFLAERSSSDVITDISMAALESPRMATVHNQQERPMLQSSYSRSHWAATARQCRAQWSTFPVSSGNISLRRAVRLTAGPNARIGSYVHNVLAPGKGEVGCAAAIDVESGLENCDEAEVSQLGTTVSLHIAAAKPLYLNVDSIPEEDAEREKAVHMEVAMQTGKPPEIAEKMITGKMRKFYEQTVLCNQKCVVDEDGLAMTKMVNKAIRRVHRWILRLRLARSWMKGQMNTDTEEKDTEILSSGGF